VTGLAEADCVGECLISYRPRDSFGAMHVGAGLFHPEVVAFPSID
jgi:hypothetical protein